MGYAGVTLAQIAAADRRAFKLMAEELQGDLGRDASGKRLADSALEKIIMEPAFITLLLPLPGAKASASKDHGEAAPEGTGTTASKRKLMRENQKLKERLKEMEAKKTKAAPQPEADKTVAPKKMPIKMPRELWGYSPMKHGERICYGYQMGSCKAGKDGKCGKGLHICMKCWKGGHASEKKRAQGGAAWHGNGAMTKSPTRAQKPCRWQKGRKWTGQLKASPELVQMISNFPGKTLASWMKMSSGFHQLHLRCLLDLAS